MSIQELFESIANRLSETRLLRLAEVRLLTTYIRQFEESAARNRTDQRPAEQGNRNQEETQEESEFARAERHIERAEPIVLNQVAGHITEDIVHQVECRARTDNATRAYINGR